MRFQIHTTIVLACCTFAAIAAAGSQECVAASDEAEFELGDSRDVPHPGATPFPRFFPLHAPSDAGAPLPPLEIALCLPDLYCSLQHG